jgi:hypothetical protein
MGAPFVIVCFMKWQRSVVIRPAIVIDSKPRKSD